jgi:hypothetical protein
MGLYQSGTSDNLSVNQLTSTTTASVNDGTAHCIDSIARGYRYAKMHLHIELIKKKRLLSM